MGFLGKFDALLPDVPLAPLFMELLDRIVVPLPCSGTREEVDKADDDDEGDEEEDDDVEDVDEALETRTPDCC